MVLGAVGAGIVSGALVGGMGGRMAMRALAITSAPRATGILTQNGNRVGEITAAGTIALVLAGVFVGMVGALTWLATKRWIPGRGWRGGLLFGLILLCLGGAFVMDPKNTDFAHLQPSSLAVGMFASLFPLFGLLFVALAEPWSSAYPSLSFRPGPLVAHAVPLLFLVLAFPFLIGLAACGVFGWRIERSDRLSKAWKGTKVQRVGYAALALGCGFGAFRLISAVARIV